VILEAACDFVRELSVIAARGRDGATAIYPLGENHHENGVLRRTIAPAKARRRSPTRPRDRRAILAGLDYVGVIGVELFELAGRPAAGQRDRPARAQHRPLDPGRL
jgi:5-(carboxyamino)imidazole ribonucleotide synthase